MRKEELRKLSALAVKEDGGGSVTVHVAEQLPRAPEDDELNRIAGFPIGVPDEAWPKFDGERMAHVLTIDLRQLPHLRSDLPADVCALALFVSDLYDNEAYQPGTGESSVLFLTEGDLAHGPNRWIKPVEDGFPVAEPQTFVLYELDFPARFFDESLEYSEEDRSLRDFEQALTGFAIVGGSPMWIQGEDHDGRVIAQFMESFVDMNLGDAGMMYVFADTAFWQCH